MLPAQHRFNLRQQPRFFSTARRAYSPYLTLWSQPNSEGTFQAAFIVPKKNVKKSTDRHRLLRHLRAAVQRELLTGTLPAVQVVVLPTRQATQLPFAQLYAEVSRLLPKST